MRRAAAILVILAGCSAPEMPSSPPPRNLPPLEHRTAPSVPPLAPKQWNVRVHTMGGFTSYGKGGIGFDSSTPLKGCAGEHRLAVENAVAAARPAMWQPSYAEGRPRMTDQFTYYLTLQIEGVEYSVSWREDNTDLLPSDLRALSDALWAAKKACS